MDYSLNATWLLLFWIIVILPLKIHDFYGIENKKTKDYVQIVIYSTFAIIASLCCMFSNINFSISSIKKFKIKVMRKFCFGILSVVCMLCFNSCGSNEVVYTLASQNNENQNFENFLKSVDSLNYTYTAHTRAGEIEESLNVEPDKLGPEGFHLSAKKIENWCASILRFSSTVSSVGLPM